MTRMPAALLVLVAGAVACRLPGDCPPPPAMVLGQWTYTASQTQPIATVRGTLTIEAGCPSFQGSLHGTQQDGLGIPVNVDAVVAGQMLNNTSVEFDAYIGVAGRRHLGTIANDSISGTWIDQNSSTIGSFVAVKERP